MLGELRTTSQNAESLHFKTANDCQVLVGLLQENGSCRAIAPHASFTQPSLDQSRHKTSTALQLTRLHSYEQPKGFQSMRTTVLLQSTTH